MQQRIRKKRQQPERAQKLAFMRWVGLNKSIRPFVFAIEHGGSRNVLEASNLRKIGVRAGIPDYFFMHPNSKYHGLWIEFKAGKNKLTKEQEEFFNLAKNVNYKCVVVWNWADAVKEIQEYIKC